MARPREFDMDEVLDAALGVFWRQGYHRTSMTDLLEVTGLHKGSLYKAFRDKRHLYITTLQRYIESVHTDWRTVLARSPSAKAAFHKWFAMSATYKGATKGCFAANTSTELAPHDPEIAKILTRFTNTLKSDFARAIEQGKHDGSIGPTVETQEVAELLTLLMFGFRVVGKHSKHSTGVVDVILSMLA